MKPRDTQRSRVYDAECAAAANLGMYSRTRTIPNDQCQAWVDDLMMLAPIQRRWKRATIKVVMKRGGSAYGGHGRVTLPLFARNEWVIMHEVAHCLNKYGAAAHGPEFAGILLYLVRVRLGTEAGKALLDSYRAHKVRYTMKAVPDPRWTPVTKTQRAAKAKAKRTRPVLPLEAEQAADVLRWAAAAGQFGPPGSKPRTYALAAARTLHPKR